MTILITILTITAVVLFFHLRRRRAQIQAQGKVLDFWNANSFGILAIVGFVLLKVGIPETDIDTIKSDLSELVLLIDVVVDGALALWLFFQGFVQRFRSSLAMIALALFAFSGDAQTWATGVDGKQYQVYVEGVDITEWDADKMYNLYVSDQGMSAQFLGNGKIAKAVMDVFKWVERNRFTEQERNIYNFGVDSLNEGAGAEVLLRKE